MAERNQDDKTKSIMHMEPEYDGEFPMEKVAIYHNTLDMIIVLSLF